jgi:RHS repeat-associated protein
MTSEPVAQPQRDAPGAGGNGAASPAPPAVSLPKGGGAIQGIGEKFGAEPATGTGSFTVPFPTSPAREGFAPELALSYDSGSGNGPFGVGWSLGLPAIRRKTDKGLPLYRDGEESDVYVLSGAEDLVPVLEEDGTRHEDDTTAPGFVIHRYRPRTEGLFARIERWTDAATGEIHWRTITRDNLTTLFGLDDRSRTVDRSDGSARIFEWHICESYDGKGSAILYEHEAETDEGVDLLALHERNRPAAARAAKRYPKRILYGNRVSLLVEPDLADAEWMFEVVFDYDEDHLVPLDLDAAVPAREQHRFVEASPGPGRPWPVRPDAFSSHRAGFEVRTYRRCRRVLMFHHIPDPGGGQEGYDGLVRATTLDYDDLPGPATIEDELAHGGSTRFGSFLRAVTQAGYARDGDRYLEKALPSLELEYSRPQIDDEVRELDAGSLENLPAGLAGSARLVDLDGEGLAGLLTEHGGAWSYKRNLGDGRFGPLTTLPSTPAAPSLGSGRDKLIDLAGDGRLDVVALAGPVPGFHERTDGDGWEPFRPFRELPNRDWDDPNLRFVDLDGDGHADVLVTEDDALTWHPSLAEDGYGPARRVARPLDEDRGARVVFADGTESVHLADMSGDGLADLVRVRNGEVCYWPSLGHGRFGPKVTLDGSPWFDEPDQFDQRAIRLADIDGSGATDVIYLGRDGVRLYFNQCGNALSAPRRLDAFPRVEDVSSVVAADLLGAGTACLVWSSPLPGDAGRPLRYVDLMGGNKPHLLVSSRNNLGAETHIHYVPSTRFYLADRSAGRPWITRLPFPVHVVERTVAVDAVSGNRFETRYAYHHGHFDGAEREFRGFGLVEQWDTATFAALDGEGEAEPASNVDATSHVPPMLTKTWFHTGVHAGREHVSDFFEDEYYREAGLTDAQARALLLDDTPLPGDLTAEEEREACRALKGSMLRQEVYALDGTDKQDRPYTVSEQTFTVRRVQRRLGNRHAVFLRHARESITYHYEREPAGARVGHALTLDVDDWGNVLTSAAVAYARREPDGELAPADQARQDRIVATWTEARPTGAVDTAHDHRVPLGCETRQYELTGLTLAPEQPRLTFDEVLDAGTTAAPLEYHEEPTAGAVEKRLIGHERTYYRRDDLTARLPLGGLQARAIPFETHRLALTPGLIAAAYAGTGEAPSPGPGGYVHSEGDANWWIPSGRAFYSADPDATPAEELANARAHFFLPMRHRDPFHTAARPTESFVAYDPFDLLIEETRDALGNRTTVGAHDYRVLQPALVLDPNRNRSAVAFDALGLVAGTAVMGKAGAPAVGDALAAGFAADLTQAQLDDFMADPTGPVAAALLDGATSRVVYDPAAQPAIVATLARETHVSDLAAGQTTRIQTTFAYTDGLGQEIQRKVIAEPGPVPERDADGRVILGADGQPQLTTADADPRWACSGWTVLNNRGKPVRQYEAFFTDTHAFEFDVRVGVSPVFFYDPVERLVATLHPDHTWDKVIYHPWRQDTWDVNDTVLVDDPRDDPDVGGHFARLPQDEYLPSWRALRQDAAHAAQAALRWPDPQARAAAARAADRSAVHAATPSTVHVDPLGRTFLAIARGRAKYSDTPAADPPVEQLHDTRTVLDVEGNKLEVADALGRVVERCVYDVAGTCVHRASMEAGERWTLADVAGNPIVSWDSRGHRFRTGYDVLRRPADFRMRAGAAAEIVVGRNVYGEGRPDPEARNLRGKMVERHDSAGLLVEDEYDFKGNRLSSRRRFAQSYREPLDWSAAVALEAETYVARLRYDAFNRPVQLVAPHADAPGTRVNVIRPLYNEANMPEAVHAWLGRATEPAALLDPATADLHALEDADYDAKGRRTRIAYGNGVVTTLDYDPLTSRLVRLRTRRDPAAFPGDCPSPAPAGWPGCLVQSLHYTHDPIGNVTTIRDDAQQAIFFRNRRVAPGAEYTYDSVYRLIEATGREHLGQVGGSPAVHAFDDVTRAHVAHAADGNAMGSYLERYVYDAAANLLSMQHRGTDPAAAGWTRAYAYDEPSLLEPARRSNRLTSTSAGGWTETYSSAGDGYDAHGNQLRMPHLPAMRWNHRDELAMTSRQTGDRTFSVYDAGGQRARKVTELASGEIASERLYLEGFEIHRRRTGTAIVRETLHITDDDQRIALVETRTAGDDGSDAQLVRYQVGDHLLSTTIELDHQGALISYAEYTPYGSTALRAVRSQTEAASRYRFTSRERDEETGLYRFGARHYAPWLGRWTSTDASGVATGVNLYVYCRGNPVRYFDPSGADGEEAAPSNWDRFLGGLKMVGGALETVAGAGLVGVGVASSEIGVGIPIAAAGLFVMGHGADTAQSGFRTAINGRPVDTFTSQGLQAAGMSRTAANLTDAGIGIVGTLGAGALTRAPAAAASVSTSVPSITISHAAGAPSAVGAGVRVTNPMGYAIGHTRVGVTLGDGTPTVWSHLRVLEEGRVMMASDTLVRSGNAVVETGTALAPRFASTATIPLTAEGAQAAQTFMSQSTGAAGAYGLFVNDCATYGGSVLNAAGVTASGMTPSTLFVSAALRSSSPASTLLTAPVVMQPLTTAGAVTNATVGATSMTYTNPPAGPRTVAGGGSAAVSPVSGSGGGGLPDPSAFSSYDDFAAAAVGPYTQDHLMEAWAAVHGYQSHAR